MATLVAGGIAVSDDALLGLAFEILASVALAPAAETALLPRVAWRRPETILEGWGSIAVGLLRRTP